MRIKAIITGATGMVGEGVLHESLLHPEVESVLVINRRPCNIRHSKLKEVLHRDFSDFSGIERDLMGYNAEFFCMGVSSVGMSEEKYRHLTYDLTMALARPLAKLNPDMTICYVSGMGTDSSERGRTMWARIKG
jgi:putative NADH-flavin reductase